MSSVTRCDRNNHSRGDRAQVSTETSWSKRVDGRKHGGERMGWTGLDWIEWTDMFPIFLHTGRPRHKKVTP